MNKPPSVSSKTFPDQDDNLMIYGLRPVLEAILAGKEVERIFIGRGAKGELMHELKNELKERNISWQEVPGEKLDRLTRKNHQDVVCFISAITHHRLDQLIPSLFENGITPLILMLDRITDVRNFGAIARTAECAGVHGIVIPESGSAQVSPDSIRTSAGALSRIPVCRERDLRKSIDFLQLSGIRVVAATEKGKEYHFQSDLTSPLAVVLGSEEDGISPAILKTADQLLRIPMLGSVASLNVSVACGIILFEAVRQRMK